MKRIAIFCALLALTSLVANKYDENFYRAYKLFKDGDFQESLDTYQALDSQGPITYYNQGVVLYHLQEFGKALAAWKKAQRGADGDLLEKIQHNCSKVREKLHSADDTSFFKVLIWINVHCSVLLFQILFLITWLCWWLSFFTPYTVLEKIRWGLLFVAIVCGGVVASCYWVAHQREAIVIVPVAKLYTGPHSEFHSLADVQEGQQVKVVDQDESWYKVLYRDSKGWMQKSDLEEITL